MRSHTAAWGPGRLEAAAARCRRPTAGSSHICRHVARRCWDGLQGWQLASAANAQTGAPPAHAPITQSFRPLHRRLGTAAACCCGPQAARTRATRGRRQPNTLPRSGRCRRSSTACPSGGAACRRSCRRWVCLGGRLGWTAGRMRGSGASTGGGAVRHVGGGAAGGGQAPKSAALACMHPGAGAGQAGGCHPSAPLLHPRPTPRANQAMLRGSLSKMFGGFETLCLGLGSVLGTGWVQVGARSLARSHACMHVCRLAFTCSLACVSPRLACPPDRGMPGLATSQPACPPNPHPCIAPAPFCPAAHRPCSPGLCGPWCDCQRGDCGPGRHAVGRLLR